MNFKTSPNLNGTQLQSGLKYIVKEGLAGEVMVNLTGGTFLIAMVLHLGATNFQIGLLAALPIFANVFQLVSVWLVKKYENRRAITLISSFIARFALIIVGVLPFAFTGVGSVEVLIFLLSIHYLFGSIAGGSWNSWMKDLVPDSMLGKYFSHRTKLMQIISVSSNLLIAIFLDYLKTHSPENLTQSYYIMILAGAFAGMLGLYWLSKADEPKPLPATENVFLQMTKPLKDVNFRNLLIFNSFWAFALNLAVPFFTVFMMKTIGLSLTYIMALMIIGQLSGIFSIKMWGRYADRYSNKTIINVCAPLYIVCIFAMVFAAIPGQLLYSVIILLVINIFSGISVSGINLALNNIGMKLAPAQHATAYISTKTIVISLASAIAPMLGGLAADFFTTHQLVWTIEWRSVSGNSALNMINLHGWNFFFIIGGILAIFSLKTLSNVKEAGEVNKDRVAVYLRGRMRKNIARGAKSIVPVFNSNGVKNGFRYFFT